MGDVKLLIHPLRLACSCIAVLNRAFAIATRLFFFLLRWETIKTIKKTPTNTQPNEIPATVFLPNFEVWQLSEWQTVNLSSVSLGMRDLRVLVSA